MDDDVQQILRRTQGRDLQLTSIGPARMSHLQRTLNPASVHRLGARKLQSQESHVRSPDFGKSIAIVGMAGRFPDAQNVEELWNVLIENRDLHRIIPIDRFDIRTHVDPTGKVKNTSLTPYGCFDEHVGEFDTSLFKMSPREAAQTDPMQRMMLLTAYEALESAGYYDSGDPEARPRNGTFYGVAGDDYRQVNSGQDVNVNYITGGTRAFGPGRVSYYFGWEGPSMSVDTACSASAVAMHQAISSLRLGECDVALAGGANLLTCSDMFAGLSRAKFVCSTGPSKTFDETADGYCRADATATVVLKRFNDSARDKDNILGVIHAIETHHAGTAISLTHPEADTQTALFESVLRSAGISIDDIDHIELHGTGTQAGDLAEASSVVRLLKEPRPIDRPLTISSVKPNVGHSEAASGVTSLIKGLLMLQHRTIPRHIGVKTSLNPKLPRLDDFNVVIPQTNMPYVALGKDSLRRMLVNNFNATGGITAMLLEEYRPPKAIAKDLRHHYPMTLSAASAMTLSHSQTRLLEHLKSTANIELSHLSYTLSARRLHHKHRFACVACSTEELIHKLQAELSTSELALKRSTSAFGVMVFTGQASSYSGMANVLFTTNDAFRSHVLRSDAICREMGLPPFVQLITDIEADISRSNPTQCQLALVALEVALASLLESWGIRPKAVVGHSLGEYSALCVSQVLSLADTLYLVGQRGLLLESTCKYEEFTMAMVSLPSCEVEKALRLSLSSECEIACLNAPDQTVVSGPRMDMESLIAQFQANNVRATRLRTPYAFHSKQMEAILSKYEQIAEPISFRKPSVPLVSTLLGEVIRKEGTLNPQYLCRQTREPVRFQDALYKIEGLVEDEQILFWIEVGPGPTCLPMIASTIRARPTDLVCALDPRKPNWLTISNLVAEYYSSNGDVRWNEYHKEYLDALNLLQLPSYPFDLKKYWIQYDGDWAIRKNTKASDQSQAAQAVAQTLESSTLHRLDSSSVEKGIRRLLFTSNLGTGDLGSMLGLYEVNGQLMCPSSIYVDMALTATSYLYKKWGHGLNSPAMEVSALELCSGLDLCRGQSIKVVATQRPSDTNIVEISISSSNHAAAAVEQVRCKVITGDGEDWASDANSNAYLYQSRMDLLNFFLTNGKVSRLSQSEVYQRFSSFVGYEKSFQGIQEVLLNLESSEAVAKIRLSSNKGMLMCDPRWLDNFTQVADLIVNYSTAKPKLTCRGWNRMHILLPLQPDAIYRVHARMQPCGQANSMIGDMHVLDEAGCVAVVIKHIRFEPVSGSKLNAAPIEIPNGANKTPYASSSQTPNFPRVNGIFDNRTQPPNISEGNRNAHYAPPVNHAKPFAMEKVPNGVSSGVSEDQRLNEPLQPSAAVNGDIPDMPPISISASPDAVPEQLRNGKASNGSSGRAVDFNEILAVMADEIGVSSDSLTDDVLLDELGVDSIIQISLIARIQDYLAKPVSPSLLVDCNSIAKLRFFFATH
ncbi:MAG: hypothetical protein Q9191_001010 [Dirinaria sp. TL-2023a]